MQWVPDGGKRRRGCPGDKHSRKICRRRESAGVVCAELPVIGDRGKASSPNAPAGVGRSKTVLLWSICVSVATTEVCYGKLLNASCPSGSVLMTDTAVYGRMQAGGQCEISNWQVGCSGDVTAYVERQCAGKQQCLMSVGDEIRTAASGCPRDQLGYIRVSYYCLSGNQHLLLQLLPLSISFVTKPCSCPVSV